LPIENRTNTIALPDWKHQDGENQEPEITAGNYVHKVWGKKRDLS